MLLSCHNICKSFDGKDILKNASFHIEANEKAAIVGINGAGKSTLLKIIIGQLSADDGEVTFAKDTTFGYLAQNQNIDSSNTIYEELKLVKKDIIDLELKIREAEEQMKVLQGDELTDLMNKYTSMTHQFQLQDGYAWQSEVSGVARGLGFTDEEFSKQIGSLSGGQKTRVALGKLLLQQPDLIILDEPTNHLDMNSISWLENYLLNYKGAVLVVSHDRFFLDRIAGKIIEIDQMKADTYNGNYSFYAKEKEKRRAIAWHAYINQQQELKHQQEVIDKLRSFNREKSIKRAESREKMLDKIERLEKPSTIDDEMKIKLVPSCVSGNDVLHIENLSKSFESATLFKDISFDIKRGERVAIIGDNGTGKTTMLKIINGIIPADSGKITLGTKVNLGYYDQEHHVLHDDKTLFEEISDEYPDLSNTQIRNTLAAFLFTGDDVFKRIGDLSGGEKGRMSLAKLMLSQSNFLLLDEPTNHLDITSKEVLESALNGYEGTVLYVSHDRYFINRTATRILDLTHGVLMNYLGDYDYYLEHQPERMNNLLNNANLATATAACSGVLMGEDSSNKQGTMHANSYQFNEETKSISSQADWKAQKAAQALKKKKEKAQKACEEEISKLEARNDEINNEISRPEIASNLAELRKRTDEQEKIQAKLEELYDTWAELAEE